MLNQGGTTKLAFVPVQGRRLFCFWMLKQASGFVLGEETSSTYDKSTPPVFLPPAALPADLFEHPVDCK